MRIKHPVKLLVLVTALMTTCFAEMLFDDSHKITQTFKQNSIFGGIDPIRLFNTMSQYKSDRMTFFNPKNMSVVKINFSNLIQRSLVSRVIVNPHDEQAIDKESNCFDGQLKLLKGAKKDIKTLT